MKKIHTLTGIAAFMALSLTTAAQAATIISADFSSHAGTTAAIPTSGNITAGTGTGITFGTNITVDDGAGVFDLDGSYVGRAAFSDLSKTETTYMAFDFTTSSAMSLTNVSIAWDVGNGAGSNPSLTGRTAGNVGFDIYQGASLVGSWTADFGDSTAGGNTDSITGTAIALAAGTTYEMRFVDLPTADTGENDVRGVLNYSSFEVTGTIPEPSTAGLLGGLLALSYVMVRRRS